MTPVQRLRKIFTEHARSCAQTDGLYFGTPEEHAARHLAEMKRLYTDLYLPLSPATQEELDALYQETYHAIYPRSEA